MPIADGTGQAGDLKAGIAAARGDTGQSSRSQHHASSALPKPPASPTILGQIIVPQDSTQGSTGVQLGSTLTRLKEEANRSTNQPLLWDVIQPITALRTSSSAAVDEAAPTAAALNLPQQNCSRSMERSPPGQPTSNGSAGAARPPTSQLTGLGIGKPIVFPPMVGLYSHAWDADCSCDV